MSKHVVYVYGTLRPGTEEEIILIPGTMYDLGWFPGVKLNISTDVSSTFIAERIEVDDERLLHLDRYEGYNPNDLVGSLYIRQPYLDGWIYEYNQDVKDRGVIQSGDWLEYRGEQKGRAA